MSDSVDTTGRALVKLLATAGQRISSSSRLWVPMRRKITGNMMTCQFGSTAGGRGKFDVVLDGIGETGLKQEWMYTIISFITMCRNNLNLEIILYLSIQMIFANTGMVATTHHVWIRPVQATMQGIYILYSRDAGFRVASGA